MNKKDEARIYWLARYQKAYTDKQTYVMMFLFGTMYALLGGSINIFFSALGLVIMGLSFLASVESQKKMERSKEHAGME